MWEFYLAASEMSFRDQNMMNFQIQITKKQGVTPMMRDYMVEAERALQAVDTKRQAPLRLAGE